MTKKIYGIEILNDTQVSGKVVKTGKKLMVPKDIGEDQARDLLRMRNRATEIKAPEKKGDGESSGDEDESKNSGKGEGKK